MRQNRGGMPAVSKHTKPRPAGIAAANPSASSESDAMKMANAFTFGFDVSKSPNAFGLQSLEGYSTVTLQIRVTHHKHINTYSTVLVLPCHLTSLLNCLAGGFQRMVPTPTKLVDTRTHSTDNHRQRAQVNGTA